MTTHTVVAPDNSQKKEFAGPIRQRLWLGTVDFGTATIRAVVEADSMHDKQLVSRTAPIPVAGKAPKKLTGACILASHPFGLDPGSEAGSLP